MTSDWKLLMLVSIIYAFTGLATANEKSLVKHLMEDYDPSVRPVKNQTTVTIVQLSVVLQNFIEVIESSETIRVNLIYNSFWTDEYLTWDPLEYDNITDIVIAANRIWLPDYIILTRSRISELHSTFHLCAEMEELGWHQLVG
uniref:Neurotransmitter-gated ion-channel ligand-binding domain-containing protein n=1 Tax=Plectus sambesii TaxID=2011161 RepID=A0A914VYS0_9BILA